MSNKNNQTTQPSHYAVGDIIISIERYEGNIALSGIDVFDPIAPQYIYSPYGNLGCYPRDAGSSPAWAQFILYRNLIVIS